MQNKKKLTKLYSFTEVNNTYDFVELNVTFYKDNQTENLIENQLLTFIDNIYYCQYSGVLLKKIDENNNFTKYSIINNQDINRMKNIMFMQICNKEELYSINNKNISHYCVANIWDEILGYNNLDKWDIEIDIYQTNPDLIKNHRTQSRHYIYIIYDTMTQMYKIGITGNLKKRYKTLLSDRFSLVVLSAFELEDKNYAIILEKKVHEFFYEFKNIGEWFNLQHLTLEQIENEITNIACNIGYDISHCDIQWSYDNRYN